MASSLFGTPGANLPNPQNNLFGMIQQFNQFKSSLSGKDPKAMVEELLQSGKMSRQQFEQLSQMANQLQGLLK